MSYLKILSLVFLAIYLIVAGLAGFLGFHLSSIANFLLGLCAVVSGILILLTSRECLHHSEK